MALSERFPDLPATNFDTHIGAEFVEVGPDRVVMSVPVTENLQQPYGLVHGGVYCTLVESCGSVAGAIWYLSTYGNGGKVVGVANHTNFLKGTTAGTLTATASPVQRGRTQQLWRIEITQDDGTLAAVGELRVANLAPRPAAG